MQPALAQLCSLQAAFAEDVRHYSAAHCPAIELWLTKLEEFLKDHTVDDVRELLSGNRLAVAAASQQGGVLASQGSARREAWRLFERRL
jgi:2-keto-myo-inositol isomerase